MLLSSSSSTGALVNDDERDDDTASSESFNAIAIRHRGGYSLSPSTFMPIFFIIQLYTFLSQLQAGF